MIAAVDVGYGFTKAVDLDGQCLFPSMVQRTDSDGDLGRLMGELKHRVEIVHGTEKAEIWRVGESARASGGVRGWSAQAHEREGYDVLLLTALALLDVNGPVDLAVGLPMASWLDPEQRGGLRSHLLGLSAWVSVNGKEAQRISTSSVKVFPQALAGLAVDTGGDDRQPIGVLDIGYRTSDYALLVPDQETKQLRPAEQYCGSIDVGASAAVESARKTIERESHRRITDALVDEALDALDGRMVVAEHQFDVADLVAKGARATATRCISALGQAWDERFDGCHLVVSGGGGLQVWEHIRSMHPRCTLSADPVFANAKGFLRAMRRVVARV